ncbi:MAG: class I tRNA ligase family protein, partial [bacterium]
SQDPDVLDTWFSSWLWTFATLGWPKDTADLKYFYPGDVLVTANEILFLWVARMIMAGLYFMDDIPFTDVYVAPTVMALDGRRMSKSLGTGIDPLEMADERGYGVDAIRFALISRCSQGQQDLRFAEKMIADVRNFNTKIWNATRFVLMNLGGFDHRAGAPRSSDLGMPERWIRSRYAQTARSVSGHLEAFEFDKAARTLYEFIWGEYCDWYLEMAKVDLQAAPAGSPRRAAVQHTLSSVLSDTMRLLHPVMPFLTEEVWHHLPHDGESIMISPWPKPDRGWVDETAEREINTMITVVRAVRSLRAELGLPARRFPIALRADDENAALLGGVLPYIAALARTDPRVVSLSAPRPEHSVTTVLS